MANKLKMTNGIPLTLHAIPFTTYVINHVTMMDIATELLSFGNTPDICQLHFFLVSNLHDQSMGPITK